MKKILMHAVALLTGVGLMSPAYCTNAPAHFGFDHIWKLIQKNSSELNAVDHENQAAEIASARAHRHWFPKVYATGRVFSTNDPASSFISVLGQRKINSFDFAPAALNEPSREFFQQGTLGIDLPLFEGGVKFAMATAAAKASESKNFQAQATRLAEFATAASQYASLLAYFEERKQLENLKARVEDVLDKYTVGSRSNPVGYSGLLGLRNLRNRIEGLLVASIAKTEVKKNDLIASAKELPADFLVKPERTKDFLSKVFTVQKQEATPLAILAANAGTEALEQSKYAERARFLPRVGVFAQGDLYRGDRATATSTTAGAYLQWELFSATSFGAVSEAAHAAAAAQARADGMQRQFESRRLGATSGVSATERAIALLDESAIMLEEQTNTAKTLFRNGSINALQLVEVLARRADLIENRLDAELQLIEVKSGLFMTSSARGVIYDN